jgi:hypothetical protein
MDEKRAYPTSAASSIRESRLIWAISSLFCDFLNTVSPRGGTKCAARMDMPFLGIFLRHGSFVFSLTVRPVKEAIRWADARLFRL